MSKYIFLDSNIIIREFLESHRVDSLGEELFSILDSKDGPFLILPEIISDELDRGLKDKASAIVKELETSFVNIKEIDDSLKQELVRQISRVTDANTEQMEKFLQRLRTHERVKFIPISEPLVLSTIIRQVKRKAPSVKRSGKGDGARPLDHDSLAVESILHLLGGVTDCDEVIICTDDGDYFFDKDNSLLKASLLDELGEKATQVTAYRDPWTMLQESFGSDIETPEPRRPQFWDYQTIEKRQVAVPPPGSIICGETLTTLYWFSDDGQRYTFPTGDILHSWFPETSSMPPVYQLTDETVASIVLGGNIGYRPGTRLVKIDSDDKIYAIDKSGPTSAVIRWIPNEETILKLYGSRWREVLVISPDVLFLDYEIGNAIEDPESFDPEDAKVRSSLP